MRQASAEVAAATGLVHRAFLSTRGENTSFSGCQCQDLKMSTTCPCVLHERLDSLATGDALILRIYPQQQDKKQTKCTAANK